jgi:hypothetical protein
MSNGVRPGSVYAFECLCGRQIESQTTETECQFCHRHIRLTWPAEDASAKAVELLEMEDGSLWPQNRPAYIPRLFR